MRKQFSWERGPMGRKPPQRPPMVDLSSATADLPAAERKAVMARLSQAEPGLAALLKTFGATFGKLQLSVDTETAEKVLP